MDYSLSNHSFDGARFDVELGSHFHKKVTRGKNTLKQELRKVTMAFPHERRVGSYMVLYYGFNHGSNISG